MSHMYNQLNEINFLSDERQILQTVDVRAHVRYSNQTCGYFFIFLIVVLNSTGPTNISGDLQNMYSS